MKANQPTRAGLNVYLLCDPANSKRKKSDYTVMWVVGLGRDERYVILDVLRDKLNLTERCDRLFDLVEQWRPTLVGYEEYGMQADVQHIQHLMEERNYRFSIKSVGGAMGKVDRIRRLMPLFEQSRIILPRSRMRTLYDKTTVNLIDAFVEEEYAAFPVSEHDDMLDALARILDLPARWPAVPDRFEKVEVIGNSLWRGRDRRDDPRPSGSPWQFRRD